MEKKCTELKVVKVDRTLQKTHSAYWQDIGDMVLGEVKGDSYTNSAAG